MKAYYIRNLHTGELDIIFGRSYKDACKRCHLEDPENWELKMETYED